MKSKATDMDVFVSKETKKLQMDSLMEHREYLYKHPQLKTLFIEMTLNCNQHCRHCGSSCGDIEMEGQLTDDEIKDALRTLKEKVPKDKSGKPILPFLNVTGGEPLLRKTFCELMHYIHHELGYNWGMTSNGYLIDKKMAKKLKEAGMYSVSISLDGLKETHDWFRNVPGCYDKALKAVTNLVEQKFADVMITTVVHKKNIDELDEIKKVVKSTGCSSWRIINVDPIGRALTDDEIRLDTQDYKRVIDYITENRAKETTLNVCYGCNHYLGPKYEKEVRPWYFLCTAGVYTAGITYNGDIGACLDIVRNEKTIQGNIRKDDLYDTWLNKFEIFRRNKAEDNETCRKCKHKNHCTGSGFHTWDLDENKPRICMLGELKKAKKLNKKSSKKKNKKK